MAESTSQTFYAALEPQRNRLWAIAMAGGGDALHAEAKLLTFLRERFAAFVQSGGTPPDLVALLASQITAAGSASFDSETAMPAAVWARLWGAVQLEAARLGTAKNLRDDSVLLSPDPLLAPKKPKPADDFSDVVPPTRLFLVATLLVLLAFVVILYFSTRHSGPMNPSPTATRPQ